MQLGFIGTGEITSSIVTGLCSFGTTSHSIRLSPRNAAVARELSRSLRGHFRCFVGTRKFSIIPTQSLSQ